MPVGRDRRSGGPKMNQKKKGLGEFIPRPFRAPAHEKHEIMRPPCNAPAHGAFPQADDGPVIQAATRRMIP
jgi:hypothetical protein